MLGDENMKRKRIVALMLAIMMSLNTVMPAYATENEINSIENKINSIILKDLLKKWKTWLCGKDKCSWISKSHVGTVRF